MPIPSLPAPTTSESPGDIPSLNSLVTQVTVSGSSLALSQEKGQR